MKSKHIRFCFLGMAVILAFPWPWPLMNGAILWISPFLFLNSFLAHKSLVFLNVFGILSLVLIILKSRWICRYACPSGAVFDEVSRIRKHECHYPKIKNFNKYLAIFAFIIALFGIPFLMTLDPFNFFHASFEVFRTGINIASIIKLLFFLLLILISVVWPNIWCSRLCPLGGMQVLLTEIKGGISGKKTVHINAERRRAFLGILAGMGAGFLIPKFFNDRSRCYFRPPSSIDGKWFNLVCSRCGNCSSACPNHIIFQDSGKENVLEVLTPKVSFEESYCEPSCTACGDVCPSGAITRFTTEEKKRLKMASVEIDPDNCLLNIQMECILCRVHCSYNAISIEKTMGKQIPLPIVDRDKCVGCGECKIVCPENAIKMKYL